SVKGTIHWVSAADATEIDVNLFDRLFTNPEMDNLEEGKEYIDYLNPDSLKVVKGYAERALSSDNSGIAVQFERLGYFIKDTDSLDSKAVYNRTVGLKSTW
ncbi:MAG TPA: glutamine--tRNA ligase, partial [Rikenellaceae bacterium]|nr:glutamine--tRNA ligase [Rikenellaceae bacterium]